MYRLSRRCHRNCITGVAVESDVVCSVGKDSTVLVHKRTESDLVCVNKFTLSKDKINLSSVDLNNNLIVTADSNGSIHLIPINTRNVINCTNGYNTVNSVNDEIDEKVTSRQMRTNAHVGLVSYVRYCGQTQVMSCGYDRKVRVWDLRNLKIPLHNLTGHTANVNYLDTTTLNSPEEYLITFSNESNKILSAGSDRTVRLWNLLGTHMVYEIPLGKSQNVECCCIMKMKPNYIFAVGLDDSNLLIYNSKIKHPITQLNISSLCNTTTNSNNNTTVDKVDSINSMRNWDERLFVGTSGGDLLILDYKLNEKFTECNVKLREKLTFPGSINDFTILHNGKTELVCAVGTEVRLGRWKTNLSQDNKNQIIIQQIIP